MDSALQPRVHNKAQPDERRREEREKNQPQGKCYEIRVELLVAAERGGREKRRRKGFEEQ